MLYNRLQSLWQNGEVINTLPMKIFIILSSFKIQVSIFNSDVIGPSQDIYLEIADSGF